VPNAVTVELSTEVFDNFEKEKQVIGVALSFLIGVAFLLIFSGILIHTFEFNFSNKYKFNQYAILVFGLIGLDHLNQLYANIYRVYKKLTRIIVGEQIYIILPLAAVWFFRGENLLIILLLSLMLSRGLSIVLYMVKAPFDISVHVNLKELKELLSIGIPLLIKNFSFYLITIAGHTIIGIFYSVEEMGYYSLAYTITNSTLLGLNTVAWLIFPTILKKTSKNVPDEEVAATVRKINDLYSTSVFLFVYCIILAIPVLFMLLPNYTPAIPVLYILLLAQAIISVSFGYNSVAISRRKQFKVAKISIVAVFFVAGISFVCALMELHFRWIAFSVLIGTFVYTYLQSMLGASLINQGRLSSGYFQSILPYGSLYAVIISLIFAFFDHTTLGGLIGFTVFTIANRAKLIYLGKFLLSKVEGH